MAAVAGRTKKPRIESNIAYSEGNIRHNSAVVEYSRTFMSAISGGTAGILGLTALYGFVFYVISTLGLSLMLVAKAGSNWRSYFISRSAIITNGFFGQLFTYVLFWTFLYGMVHVY